MLMDNYKGIKASELIKQLKTYINSVIYMCAKKKMDT